MANFSDRLKEAMENKHVSSIQLAEMTGLSRGAISNYLSGRYVAKQTNTFRIAQALEVDPSWLMGKNVPAGNALYSPIFGRIDRNRYDQVPYDAEDITALTNEEYDLLDLYRNLSAENQKMILSLIRSMKPGGK